VPQKGPAEQKTGNQLIRNGHQDITNIEDGRGSAETASKTQLRAWQLFEPRLKTRQNIQSTGK
jgi:hypothetical protein